MYIVDVKEFSAFYFQTQKLYAINATICQNFIVMMNE